MIYKQPDPERSASVLRVSGSLDFSGIQFVPTEKFWIPGSFRANSRKVLGGGRFQINFREGWQDVKKKKKTYPANTQTEKNL